MSITLTEPADKDLRYYLIELRAVEEDAMTRAETYMDTWLRLRPQPQPLASSAAASVALTVAAAPASGAPASRAPASAMPTSRAAASGAADSGSPTEAAEQQQGPRPSSQELPGGDDFDPKEGKSLASLFAVRQLSRRSPREVKRLINHLRLAKCIWRASEGALPNSDEQRWLLGWVCMSCFHTTALQTVLDAKVRWLPPSGEGGVVVSL